jgi:hypothetical protein
LIDWSSDQAVVTRTTVSCMQIDGCLEEP